VELGVQQGTIIEGDGYLEILEGWVSVGLYGITVLWTMVERWVQPLKQQATLLYDYSRVEDPTRETTKMLKVFEVMK
jgi:hypothetical protein